MTPCSALPRRTHRLCQDHPSSVPVVRRACRPRPDGCGRSADWRTVSPKNDEGLMSRLSVLILIAALVGPGVATAQPVRKYDDKGASPFKVLKEGENPPLGAYDN